MARRTTPSPIARRALRSGQYTLRRTTTRTITRTYEQSLDYYTASSPNASQLSIALNERERVKTRKGYLVDRCHSEIPAATRTLMSASRPAVTHIFWIEVFAAPRRVLSGWNELGQPSGSRAGALMRRYTGPHEALAVKGRPLSTTSRGVADLCTGA